VIDDEAIANETELPVEIRKPQGADSLLPERWLQEYGDLLFRISISKVRDQDLAEDLVQETLISAWRARDSFEGRATESTWLVGILRRRIADHFRKQTRRNRIMVDSQLAERSSPAGDTDQKLTFAPSINSKVFQTNLEAGEFREIVNDCLKTIPIHLRQAFQLRLANSEMDISQISQLLGINASNTSVRLYRARLLMRHCVERKWSAS